MNDVDQPPSSKKWPGEATTRVSGGLEDFFRRGDDLKCVEGPENPEHEGARPPEDANVKRSLEAGTTGPETPRPAKSQRRDAATNKTNAEAGTTEKETSPTAAPPPTAVHDRT